MIAVSPTVRRTLWRVAAVAGLLAALFAGWAWHRHHWRPDRAAFAMQGVAVGPANLPISWDGLASQGVRFGYIDATFGAAAVNRSYGEMRDAARASGLRTGPVHHFAVCALATDQAAAFIRLVPRAIEDLPPAILLDIDGTCDRKPTRALLVSELTTFLNQVETHLGKPAVVGTTAAFDRAYALAGVINRPAWVASNRTAPGPDAAGWLIWQSNDALTLAGATGPARWLVLNTDDGTRQ